LSSGKTKKNAIFFKKNCFSRENGAISMVFQVLKRRSPTWFPAEMPEKAPDMKKSGNSVFLSSVELNSKNSF